MKDPAQFIQTWLESQSRDLENILGSGPTEGQTVRQEELKRSEFFQLPWVEEVRFAISRDFGPYVDDVPQAVAISEGLRLASKNPA